MSFMSVIQSEYFAGLITMAKVMKIEVGDPRAFDRPASPEETLDRLERTAGPHACKMLERFLKQMQQAEAKFNGETEM
jgi:hypothetical protein